MSKIKEGDYVKVTDGSYSLVLKQIEGKRENLGILKHKSGINLNGIYEVIATNQKLPIHENFTKYDYDFIPINELKIDDGTIHGGGEFNNLILFNEDNNEIIFTKESHVEVVKHGLEEGNIFIKNGFYYEVERVYRNVKNEVYYIAIKCREDKPEIVEPKEIDKIVS